LGLLKVKGLANGDKRERDPLFVSLAIVFLGFFVQVDDDDRNPKKNTEFDRIHTRVQGECEFKTKPLYFYEQKHEKYERKVKVCVGVSCFVGLVVVGFFRVSAPFLFFETVGIGETNGHWKFWSLVKFLLVAQFYFFFWYFVYYYFIKVFCLFGHSILINVHFGTQ
jgi:hypothetical protein